MFAASPGDVETERSALTKVVDEINLTVADEKGIFLELVKWETHAYPGMGRAQALINKQIGTYDIFIGIMWKRFGSPTGAAASGTEEEFRLAYDLWHQQALSPHIAFYFCNAPSPVPESDEEIAQLAKVMAFRKELQQKGLIWPYVDLVTFSNDVRRHLFRILREMFHGSASAAALSRETVKRVGGETATSIIASYSCRRFVCSKITGHDLLDLSTHGNPYMRPSDPMDFDEMYVPSSVLCLLRFPNINRLKEAAGNFMPVSALCVVDPLQVVTAMRDALDQSVLSELIKISPSNVPLDKKAQILSSLGDALGGCFVVALAIPNSMISMRFTNPITAYRILTNLVLPTVLVMHSNLGVQHVNIKIGRVGIGKDDSSLNKNLIGFCKEITKTIYDKTRDRRMSFRIDLCEHSEAARILDWIARCMGWVSTHFHNTGDERWISIIRKKLE